MDDDLDITIARHVAEKLASFKGIENGYPSDYGSLDAWLEKIDSIQKALESYARRDDLELDEAIEVSKAGQQAIRELADIFPNLWI